MCIKICYYNAEKLLSADNSIKQEFIIDISRRISAERLDKILLSKSDNDRLRSSIATLILQGAVNEMLHEVQSPLQFEYTSYGQPYLSEYPDISFSISHSGSMIICAITLEKIHLGIDIQEFSASTKWSALSSRFFTLNEQIEISGGIDEEACKKNFFRHWSAKEAYIKMKGTGLSCSLDSFTADVSSGVITSVNGKEAVAYIYELTLDTKLSDASVSASAGVHPPYSATLCTDKKIPGDFSLTQLTIDSL